MSETRLQPLIEDCPETAREIPEDKDDYKKLEYKLKRSTLRFVGANSAGKLASRPIRYLFLDEVEKYKDKLGSEGSVVSLAEQRTKTFWNRKIWKCSSPTTVDGYIHSAFLDGDQRRFFVPCPHCSAMQWLKWTQVKFDSKLDPQAAGDTARYECESCKALWTNIEKNNAVQSGEWRPTAKSKQAGHASFHISSLYGPWDSCSLEWLTTKFLTVKDNLPELQDFINSDLGEAWEDKSIRMETSELEERKGPYEKGQCFADASPLSEGYKGIDKIKFMSIDVQKFGFWWIVRQWCAGGDSGLVDYGFVHSWEDLDAVANSYDVPHVLIDSGYGERTTEVYEACIRWKFIPCKGGSQRMLQDWMQTTVNIYEGTRKQTNSNCVTLIMHDTVNLKLKLQDRIRGIGPFAWYVYQGIGKEYASDVTSEEYVNGEWRLKRGHRDNHLWDCEVMQLLAATMYGYNTRIFSDTKQVMVLQNE
jgi:phage terminase large subunit GpA-like protein